MFKEKERYYVFNPQSENHKYYLTIIKVESNIIYFFFDGDDSIKSFVIGSDFEYDLIKLVYY